MHELSLCRTILEIINKQASKINCQRVKKIYLEVGQLAGVDKEALLFGFSVVVAGTVADKANLEIIEVEGRAVCNSCHETVMLKNYYDSCEICGHLSLRVTQGEELRVKSMEVE